MWGWGGALFRRAGVRRFFLITWQCTPRGEKVGCWAPPAIERGQRVQSYTMLTFVFGVGWATRSWISIHRTTTK